jgi:TolB-like protein
MSGSTAPRGKHANCTRDRPTNLAKTRRGEKSGLEAPIPAKPSIVVLPFLNLSGDLEQEYFADGVVEEVIVALSRVDWLFVIARNSSFAFKGRLVDVRQVQRELGVRYILEGSVRKSSNRVRITGQLVDATTGANLWAERFEGALDDIFQLQDEMVTSVVGAIMPRLERAEIERAQHKPTENLDAYDYFLRGMTCFHQGTRDGLDRALSLFQRTIDLDPQYASAYGMAAFCCYWRKISGWVTDYEEEASNGYRLALRAVELGRNDAVALTRGGHALAHFGGDLDTCIRLLDRALVLNPNISAAWYLSGFQRISRGEPDLAIPRFERAMRLSPLDLETVRMRTGIAMAHLFAGRIDAASSWADKASSELPGFLLAFGIVAAIYALAGRSEDSQRAMGECRRLNPTLRISNLSQWVLLRRPQDLAILADGLRKSGLPE